VDNFALLRGSKLNKEIVPVRQRKFCFSSN